MTTETSEALAKATNSEGLMKSSYFKLKFNPETGQWEKEQIEATIEDPVFPGIRDVTPDYTEEGKKFRTIPIGAGPDYTPVTPEPPSEIVRPVEPVEPEEPVVEPIVQRPTEVTGGGADAQTGAGQVIKKNTTQVNIDGLTYNTSIIQQPTNYRDKYSKLPGGLNNWSESQLLNYAIDTGTLNTIIPQSENPYYVAPAEEQKGLLADVKAPIVGTAKIVAGALDSTLGVLERKALINRLIETNIISGTASDYLDDKGNYKLNPNGDLLQKFSNDNTRTSLQSTVLPDLSVEFGDDTPSTQFATDTRGTSRFLPMGGDESLIKRVQEVGLGNTALGKGVMEQETFTNLEDVNTYRQKVLQRINKNKTTLGLEPREIKGATAISDARYNEVYLPKQKENARLQNEILIPELDRINRIQAGVSMGLAGIRGVGDTRALRRPEDTTIPPYIATLRQHSVSETGVLTPGISSGTGGGSQPKMGTSGSHTNGEAVYIDSSAGHYTSDGKYHVDTNGDGKADKVVSRGSASNAMEAANNGFIPQKTLDRMTNPDGSLKKLYTPEGNFTISKNVEVRDGKYYYVGKAVAENREVVDKKTNTVVDTAAPSGSNDDKDHQFKKAAQDSASEDYTQSNYEQASGTGSGGESGGASKDKKEKIVCTEMYRQTQLDDWQRTIKLWYLFQKKYLSETHQKGYHFLFKPFVKGMQKSNILTSIGRHFAQERTKDIKHIMYGTKFSLLGRVYRIILEPICFVVGLLLWQKK